MKVLHSVVPDAEEEVIKMIDATDAKYHRLLKSSARAVLEKRTWTCGGGSTAGAQRNCPSKRSNNQLEPVAYVPSSRYHKKSDRMQAYLQYIVAPGLLSECSECVGDESLICDIYSDAKPRRAFTRNQL